MNYFDIIPQLIDVVDSFSFKTFQTYRQLQDRIPLSDEVRKVIEKALSLREGTKLPFWDSVNVSLFNQPLSDFSVLGEIQFHNFSSSEIMIKADEVKNFLASLNVEEYLTISSRVVSKIDSTFEHIPLLDFHIPIAKENLALCERIIQNFGLKGYLLDSGKSYHFIGLRPISEVKARQLLYRSLLYSPIIDKTWIAHQLIEGASCLRITKKYNRLPIVVSEI